MIKRWLEHKTNPLHVWCRMIGLHHLYDKIWKRLFCPENKKILTNGDLITLTRLVDKKKRLLREKKKLLEIKEKP